VGLDIALVGLSELLQTFGSRSDFVKGAQGSE